jgi:hypothetical protein
MLTFKSTEDLNKLSPDDPSYPVIKELIEDLISAYTWEGHPYNPDWYGYIILVEPGDADRVLDELWDDCTLLNIPWEGSHFVTSMTAPIASGWSNIAGRDSHPLRNAALARRTPKHDIHKIPMNGKFFRKQKLRCDADQQLPIRKCIRSFFLQ